MKKEIIGFLIDGSTILGPMIVALLLFCFYKKREQRKMYEAVLKDGIWIGSGEKIDG